MLRFIFILLFIAFVGNVSAQSTTAAQKDIIGTIWEKPTGDDNGMALPGANVQLLNARDSSLVKAMAVGTDGAFVFSEIKQGDYILVVSFLGFNTHYINISSERFTANRNRPSINLRRITLLESALTLEGITIVGQIPEVVIKEDTLEYNAAAFKVADGATVEDLLKQLPGVEVEPDGNISDNTGRSVRRVFVNGREFFGNDPRMATRNLTADMVDRVQVIERMTEQAELSGVDDGERETIINLIIRKNRMQGWLGNVTAGGGMLIDDRTGAGPRYTTQGMLNKFTESSQISFVVNSNNLNNQTFTDRGNNVRSGREGGGGGNISFGGGGGGGGNFGGGGNRGGSGGGITNSNSLGVNISTFVSEKFKIGGNVNYNYSEHFTNRNSFRTNLMKDSVSYRRAKSEGESFSHNLRFNSKMEWKPDSLYTFLFSPGLSFNMSNSNDISFQETLAGDIDLTRVNQSSTNSGMNSSGMVLEGELIITRVFPARRGRRLSVTMNGNLNLSNGYGTNNQDNQFFLQPGRNRYLDQRWETTSNTGSYSIRASFTEPITKNINLQASYFLRRNETLNIRESFDKDIEGNYTELNHDFSKSLNNSFINQTMSLSLNGNFTKYTYNVGMNVDPSYTQSTSFIKNGISEGRDSTLNKVDGRKVVNYSPRVNFTYRFNRETNLRFTYNGRTRQPSISQLDPTPNNTNALNIRMGNPDLLPSYTNNMQVRFNKTKREAQRSFTTSADYGFTINEIINFTTNDYDPETGDIRPGTGIQRTAPINENGSWNTSGNVMFNMPLGKSKKLRFSTDTRVSYNNRVGYTTVQRQSQRNIQGTFGFRENISLSYSQKWFYGQLRANVYYSKTNNTLEGIKDQINTDYRVTYNTQLTLPWSTGINSDVNYVARRGLSTGYNKDEVIWNVGLSKQFLKANAASLRITWTDILQQRLNISRNITANYIEDSEFNALTSYVLVTFSYRFNKTSNIRNRTNNDAAPNSPQRGDGQNRPQRDFRQGGDWGGQRGSGQDRGGMR